MTVRFKWFWSRYWRNLAWTDFFHNKVAQELEKLVPAGNRWRRVGCTRASLVAILAQYSYGPS